MLTSDLRGLVSRRKDPFSGWGKGKLRAEGRPRGTPPPPPPPHRPTSFPFTWKERLMGLTLQLSKYFCFPFAGWNQPLFQPAPRAFRAVALSCGVAVSLATLARVTGVKTAAQFRGHCCHLISLFWGMSRPDNHSSFQGLPSCPFFTWLLSCLSTTFSPPSLSPAQTLSGSLLLSG